MNWDRKATWHGLMTLLFVLSIAWIAISRVPPDIVAADQEPSTSPQVGLVAPDFSLKTLEGETLRLSELRGQVVLINFWATWCPPCRAEMPAIQQLYDQYRDRGLTVLAVDLKETEADVADFAQQMELTFPILVDQDGQVFSRYGVIILPSTFFVDPKGVIQEITIGGPMPQPFIESKITGMLVTKRKS